MQVSWWLTKQDASEWHHSMSFCGKPCKVSDLWDLCLLSWGACLHSKMGGIDHLEKCKHRLFYLQKSEASQINDPLLSNELIDFVLHSEIKFSQQEVHGRIFIRHFLAFPILELEEKEQEKEITAEENSILKSAFLFKTTKASLVKPFQCRHA